MKKNLPAAILVAILAAGLLAGGSAVAGGVRRGLTLCAGVLIPALFPFMVLCCYLLRSGAARVLALPLRPFCRLLRLPGDMGAVLLLSLIGGYPVGAKMIAGLHEQGRLDTATARRMLCFCVNCSPSFLLSAVGAGMLRDRRAGAALLAAQLLATLAIALVTALQKNAAVAGPGTATAPKRPAAASRAAFVPAVADASASMLGICAYTVLFSGLLALLGQTGLIAVAARLLRVAPTVAQAAAAGLFEVTSGSLAAAALGGEAAIVGISLCCSWGGLSVLFQVFSFFDGKNTADLRAGSHGPFILSRLAHGCLAGGIALPLCRRLGGSMPVWTGETPPVLRLDARSLVVCGCLLAMCSILVLQFRPNGAKAKRG